MSALDAGRAVEPLVIFTPSGRRGHVAAGTTVLDAARSLGVDIDSVCGGRGLCGRCQVVQQVGEFPKHGIVSAPASLSSNRDADAEYAQRVPLPSDRRLSCLARVLGDAVIDVPPDSQVHRQVVRKELDARTFEVDPVVRLHYVEVEPPTLASPSGDLGRLLAALEHEWGLRDLVVDLSVVRALQPAFAEGGYGVTVAVHRARDLIAVWPGFHDRAFGAAVDVGSTTIAAHVADLATGAVLASGGVMNPQIRFGEDLMSRVSYAMLHRDGATEMTKAVRKAIDGLLATLAERAGIKRAELLELVFVGNPIMHHLLLGIDPVPLGSAPFALAVDTAVRTTTAALNLVAHPGARVHVLPCIAGHVGADTAGVLLAEAPQRAGDVRVVVDVGTNAEILLAAGGRLLAASSPTGPAFEGAQISSGQRAAPGAIERVRIDRDTLEPRVKVIGTEAWSHEPAFDGTAVTGICGSGIVEAIAELFLVGVIRADGTIDGTLATRTDRIQPDGRTFAYRLHDGAPPILVTQNDVRAIQLAKAALYAGIRLLMDHAGVEEVDAVRLAGAFGSQIDPFHAQVLGLIPDCPPGAATGAGNAAGTGALMALLSGRARDEIDALVRTVEKVETAVEARFQEHFVDAMALPHRTAPMPHLRARVDLPAPHDPSAGPSVPRRRGGRLARRPADHSIAPEATAAREPR